MLLSTLSAQDAPQRVTHGRSPALEVLVQVWSQSWAQTSRPWAGPLLTGCM